MFITLIIHDYGVIHDYGIGEICEFEKTSFHSIHKRFQTKIYFHRMKLLVNPKHVYLMFLSLSIA